MTKAKALAADRRRDQQAAGRETGATRTAAAANRARGIAALVLIALLGLGLSRLSSLGGVRTTTAVLPGPGGRTIAVSIEEPPGGAWPFPLRSHSHPLAPPHRSRRTAVDPHPPRRHRALPAARLAGRPGGSGRDTAARGPPARSQRRGGARPAAPRLLRRGPLRSRARGSRREGVPRRLSPCFRPRPAPQASLPAGPGSPIRPAGSPARIASAGRRERGFIRPTTAGMMASFR